MKIGFMQGRLSKIERGRIQSFPFNNWANEFTLAKKNGFKLIEWTIDSFKIDKNPILTKKGISEIEYFKKKMELKLRVLLAIFLWKIHFIKKKRIILIR